MSKLEEIITGWTNLTLGNNKEQAEERAKICIECPKMKDNFCNRSLGGCGCYLPAKTANPTSKCPDGLW